MQFIFVFPFLILTCCAATGWCSHLPEDKRDDGVELVREKRDNFIDRILKSIPFFHMASPTNVLDEEQVDQFNDDDDASDDDDDDDQPSTTSPPLYSSTTVSTLPSYITASSMVLSATVPNSPTAYSDQSSYSVSMSKDAISSTPVYIESSTSTPLPTTIEPMINTSPALNSILMSASIVEGDSPDSFMGATAAIISTDTIINATSYTYPSSASTVSMMSVSNVVPTTISKMVTTASAGSHDDSEPVIKMMIMSGESPMRVQEYGARLPDERGYADGVVGRQQIGEDIDVKNIRFMYASVLVPVMSGLVGALLITFGILIFKCIKRKKLKRVRYYGAKPGSGLYRLDQIGLLSDMSSDEE